MNAEAAYRKAVDRFERFFELEAKRLKVCDCWEPWLNEVYTAGQATVLSRRRVDIDLGFSIQLDSGPKPNSKRTVWRTFGESTLSPIRHFVILASRSDLRSAERELQLFLEKCD